jgi:hypothetical protein
VPCEAGTHFFNGFPTRSIGKVSPHPSVPSPHWPEKADRPALRTLRGWLEKAPGKGRFAKDGEGTNR